MKELLLTMASVVVLAMVVVGLITCSSWVQLSCTKVTGFKGGSCYPNDTCDKGLVCYPIDGGRCELPGLQPKRVP